jgi:hypothetical protein
LVALQIAVRAVPELDGKPLLELSMPMSRDEAVLAKAVGMRRMRLSGNWNAEMMWRF